MFFKIGVFKQTFHNIRKKAPVLQSILNKTADLRTCIFIKKVIPTQVFPCEYCIAKFLKTTFSWNTFCSFYFSQILYDDITLWTSLGRKLTFFIFIVLLLCFWFTGIPGLWTQELVSERMTLDAGCRMLDSGTWTLGVGLWMLDPGRWTLDAGRRTLNVRLWTLKL